MAIPPRTPIVYPSELDSDQFESIDLSDAKRWIQIAKTGKFFSQRYGNFEISPTDLKQMLHNFKDVTPASPTQLPVDYDHLSMDPKKPGDGKAAGWFQDLELRGDGKELWGEVEFTPDAADAISKKEYRFVSPSFVKNYVHKDGSNIGTTLLAAAITNHPFLEGMQAVTLSHGLGEMAVLTDGYDLAFPPAGKEKGGDDPKAPKAAAPKQPKPGGSAMEVGQRVAVKAEINPTLVGQSFEIIEVVGAGDDAFAKLQNDAGQPMGWFRVTELEPAAAPLPAQPEAPGMPPGMGVNMSTMFKLRNASGQDVEVNSDDVQKFMDDQIAAARKAGIPEGSVVINASKMQEFEANSAKVIDLETTVQALQEANEQATKNAHVLHLTNRLQKMQEAGLITKPKREWALKLFGDPMAAAAFDEWAATETTPVVEVGREHGTSVDSPGAPPQASGQMLVLAKEVAQREGINLRDALRKVSMDREDLSVGYRNEIREDGMRKVKPDVH